MSPEIQKLLEKADHALEVAEKLHDEGYPSDAASKIYYAMYYAAQALLKSENIDVVKHSAVEAALGYYFVEAGQNRPKIPSHAYRRQKDPRDCRLRYSGGNSRTCGDAQD